MATATLPSLEPKALIRPTHWSKEVENAYRFQLAGYRDELEYKRIRQVAEVFHFLFFYFYINSIIFI
jgi:hypothetical protein